MKRDYDGKDRKAYLQSLVEEFGLSEYVVFSIARLLGPNEDYDGLITALEDLDPEDF